MKLTDIAEGTFGNLISLAAAKIGSKPEDRMLVKGDERLYTLAQTARQFEYHLFDRRALPWWKQVLNHFKIPGTLRNEVITAARSEFFDRIDHTLFEDLSKFVDFLNPRTRGATVKTAARAATNERLAVAILGYVARAAARITPSKKKKAMADQIQPPPPPPGVSGPSVKRWKRMPGEKVIRQAIQLAQGARRSSGATRRAYLERLDRMGFRVDWDLDPPKLKLKR